MKKYLIMICYIMLTLAISTILFLIGMFIGQLYLLIL